MIGPDLLAPIRCYFLTGIDHAGMLWFDCGIDADVSAIWSDLRRHGHFRCGKRPRRFRAFDPTYKEVGSE